MKVQIICAILAVSLAVIVMAEEDKEQQLIKDIKKLEQKAAVIAALNVLDFNEQQLKTVYDCIRRAQSLKLEFMGEMKTILKGQEQAYEAFKQEDMENKGFKPETEKRAAQAEGNGIQLREKFFRQINKLEEEVKNVLTEDQLRIIESSKLLEQLTLAKIGRKPPINPKVFKIVKDIRDLEDEEYEEQIEKLARRLVTALKVNLQDIEDKEEYTNKVYDALDEIRRLSEDELQPRLPVILDELMIKDEKAKIHEELEEQRKHKHGGIGNIGKFLIYDDALDIVANKLGIKPEKLEPSRKLLLTEDGSKCKCQEMDKACKCGHCKKGKVECKCGK